MSGRESERCSGRGPHGVWGICLCGGCNRRRAREEREMKERESEKVPEPDKRETLSRTL